MIEIKILSEKSLEKLVSKEIKVCLCAAALTYNGKHNEYRTPSVLYIDSVPRSQRSRGGALPIYFSSFPKSYLKHQHRQNVTSLIQDYASWLTSSHSSYTAMYLMSSKIDVEKTFWGGEEKQISKKGKNTFILGEEKQRRKSRKILGDRTYFFAEEKEKAEHN